MCKSDDDRLNGITGEGTSARFSLILSLFLLVESCGVVLECSSNWSGGLTIGLVDFCGAPGCRFVSLLGTYSSLHLGQLSQGHSVNSEGTARTSRHANILTPILVLIFQQTG